MWTPAVGRKVLMRWSQRVGNGSTVQNFEGKMQPEFHIRLYRGSANMLQRVQRGEVWSALIILELSDHTWVRQGTPPHPRSPPGSFWSHPFPLGPSPSLGRWTLGKGAGDSCFQARASRPLLLIRQAATLNFSHCKADS